ncbi:uncharacterized protein L201_000290 [Kwoniella dendrophila CBS 6074]|uniref:Histone-lysine N-methyltransferase SET5 n=1 Tax=Kwoniella dendrophila CBS 6074 TaxID=1295534 RepID=A0AAX4JIZ4_9TREE
MSGISPTDDELQITAQKLRETNPTLGISKLLAQLKIDHPEWTVSEKRFKKFITPTTAITGNDSTNGGEKKKVSNGGAGGGGEDELIAKTGIDHSIDIANIAPKVKVKMFNIEGKGKGLVAKEKLQKGELLWQEEPWIVTTDPDLWPYLTSREMCTQCLTLFDSASSLSLSVMCKFCGEAQFCNRICYQKATRTSGAHNEFLCSGQNKSISPLLKFIKEKKNRDLQGVVRILSQFRKIRDFDSSPEHKDRLLKELENRVWNSMARISQKVKEEERREWPYIAEDRLEEWRLTHLLILRALNPSPEDESFVSFQQFLKSKSKKVVPLTKEEEERWFSYDSFLELLGLIGLNQESSGGLYALHSHLNHNCDPNLQVRNLPKTWTPPTSEELPAELPSPMTAENRGTNKISIIVKKTVHPGDELFISYVNQNLSRDERRSKLREQYGFWCFCNRCNKEKKLEDKEKEQAQQTAPSQRLR